MADDFSELYQLVADLESAPQNLAKPLATALGRTSKLIKEDAQKSVRKRKGLGHAASAIDYDLEGVSGPVSEMSSEIGYSKDKPAGKLGNLIEYGAPNAGNQLSPSHDLGNALLNNEEDFIRGVGKAVDDALKQSSL